VKTATPATYSAVGNVIGYSYLVTNSGNTTLAGPFTVSDDRATDESCPATASLAPGASLTCTASYTITQADLDSGTVTNIASATNGTVTSPTDTATVTAVQRPALTIVKTATPATYSAVGNVIGYSYLVTNSGNTTLAGPFTVSDDRATNEACPVTASLAPGASITCTASYTITQADLNAGSVTNIAFARGFFRTTPVTSPTDTETVTAVQRPALTIVKTATPATYSAVGAVISYSYLVTNSGNVTLSGPFTVSDDKATDESCPVTASLAPGASITCTASYTITQADLNAGSVTNIAAAHGFFGTTPVTSPTDTETVTGCTEGGHGLLGIVPGLPKTLFSNTSSLSYTAATGALKITATPTFMTFPTATKVISGSRSVSIQIFLNPNGTVAGGVAGSDFVLRGTVTHTNGRTYTGVLLTGEIVSFGYRDGGAGLPDQFDFRFKVTAGGLLSFDYLGKDIGITLTSDSGNTFAGVFRANFRGNAKGTVGPIAPFVCR